MSTLYYKVNGTDVSEYCNNLSIVNRISITGDTCIFNMVNPATEPVSGQEVQIYLDNTTQMLFKGLILTSRQSIYAPNTGGTPIWQYQLNCGNYLRQFNKRLVVEHYEDKTSSEIIADIVANYTDAADGFTANNVIAGLNDLDIWFNYRYPADCVKELAELEEKEFYIDSDKDIHFFFTETGDTSRIAPYNITDTTLETVIENFQITTDNTQIRNYIFVQGDYIKANEITWTTTGNANQRIWTLPYKPHDISLVVGGVAKTPLGQENVNTDDGTYPYFYNFYEQTIFCATAEETPGNDVAIAVTFKPEMPILVVMQSTQSQTYLAGIEGGDGKYEYLVRDLSGVKDTLIARNTGRRELNRNAYPRIEGSFSVTNEYGYFAGQKITLNATGCSYNSDYVINEVNIDSMGNNNLTYKINFSGLYKL